MFRSTLSPRLYSPPRMKARLSREHHKEVAGTGKAPIYLKLTYLRCSTYVATGVYLLAKEWDAKGQTARGREPEHDTARGTLRMWLGDAEETWLQHRKDEGLTVQLLKKHLLGMDMAPMTLLSIADAFYQNKARPEMSKAFNTLRLYKSRRLALENYLGHLKSLALPATAIDKAWLRHFERWCVGKQGYAVSTTHKYVSFVQELIDFATHEKWLTVNPVEKYRFEVSAPAHDPAYLPEVDVQTLVKATHLPRTLDRARVAWLFCCFTGLSYVDYARFDAQQHLHTDHKGERWLRINRQKTGAWVSVPVLKELAVLLANAGYVVPKLESTHLNHQLKEVSTVLGLSLPLTAGLARHTASHRFRNLYGFTADEAGGMLGHSREVQHANYSRMREEGLTLAKERLGLKAKPLTLLEQLQAALADPCAAPGLREQLAKLVGLPSLMPSLKTT